MSLKEYQQKRRFGKTPEPKGALRPKPRALGPKQRFVVHEHHARALHWDFRLEIDGILKSWAVPKGVPTKIGEKRLAVQVEDHPVAYAKFHGIIPKGEYGAGKVEIWDKGSYQLIEKTPKSLKFILKGKELKGPYVLYNFKGKNWLIFKVR